MSLSIVNLDISITELIISFLSSSDRVNLKKACKHFRDLFNSNIYLRVSCYRNLEQCVKSNDLSGFMFMIKTNKFDEKVISSSLLFSRDPEFLDFGISMGLCSREMVLSSAYIGSISSLKKLHMNSQINSALPYNNGLFGNLHNRNLMVQNCLSSCNCINDIHRPHYVQCDSLIRKLCTPAEYSRIASYVELAKVKYKEISPVAIVAAAKFNYCIISHMFNTFLLKHYDAEYLMDYFVSVGDSCGVILILKKGFHALSLPIMCIAVYNKFNDCLEAMCDALQFKAINDAECITVCRTAIISNSPECLHSILVKRPHLLEYCSEFYYLPYIKIECVVFLHSTGKCVWDTNRMIRSMLIFQNHTILKYVCEHSVIDTDMNKYLDVMISTSHECLKIITAYF